MSKYVPSQLPAIDTVVIVELSGSSSARMSQDLYAPEHRPMALIAAEQARQIAALWRALPPGVQKRCHFPPYGLRFQINDEVICQASICWECCNILGQSSEGPVFYGFDASHSSSQELLLLCERAFGKPPRATEEGSN